MIEATALYGNESQVAEKIEGLFEMGATEILVSPIGAGRDRADSVHRTLRLVAQVSQSVQT